jgi:ABC-type (unclassified) transport system, ATPase component
MATLVAENLAKAYKGRRVVEDVSLQVKSGEIVGLLGPNGAGKTTTFYMVVGIVPRDAGRIVIDDEDISILPLHARARRGYWLSAAGSVNLPPSKRVRQSDGGVANPR